MQPEIYRKPAFKFIGVQYRGNMHHSDKCISIWDKFAKRFEEVTPLAKQPIMPFGIHTNLDMENDICDHTAGIEVEKIDVAPVNMTFLEIPEQEYAVFKGTVSTIMETVMSYKEWFQKTGYKRSGGPELLQFYQVYDIVFNPMKTDASLSFYLPIMK